MIFSTSSARSFFTGRSVFRHELQFNRELPDDGLELVALPLKLLLPSVCAASLEHPGHSLLNRLFSVGDLHGVQLGVLGDLLDRFDSLEHLKGCPGFKFWIVSAAFGFHLRWFLGLR
jgi:hypothetical protein